MEAVTNELKVFLKDLGEATARVDADEILSRFYDDDVLIVGEGSPGALRGAEAFRSVLSGYLAEWGAGVSMVFRLDKHVVASETVASAYVDATCQPARPDAETGRYRVHMVWQRGPKGWRIVQEMFAVGSL